MQRKETKQSRGPNSLERKFQGWLKHQNCCNCGNPPPSICDHARGSAFKHNRTLIGHMFCTSRCLACDTEKTIRGRRLYNESEKCLELIERFESEFSSELRSDFASDEYHQIKLAIADWNK